MVALPLPRTAWHPLKLRQTHCEDLDGEVAREELHMRRFHVEPQVAAVRPSPGTQLNVRLTGERLAQHRKPARVSSTSEKEEAGRRICRHGQGRAKMLGTPSRVHLKAIYCH